MAASVHGADRERLCSADKPAFFAGAQPMAASVHGTGREGLCSADKPAFFAGAQPSASVAGPSGRFVGRGQRRRSQRDDEENEDARRDQKGTVPFSSDENRDSPQLGSTPPAGRSMTVAGSVFRAVVWRFLRNRDVMGMTLPHTGW